MGNITIPLQTAQNKGFLENNVYPCKSSDEK